MESSRGPSPARFEVGWKSVNHNDIPKTSNREIALTEQPAASSTAPSKLSVLQAVRKWPKISAWCLAVSTGVILGGFDVSIISSVASLPEFQSVLRSHYQIISGFNTRFSKVQIWSEI